MAHCGDNEVSGTVSLEDRHYQQEEEAETIREERYLK
jgi:hypothetical protein